VEPSGQPLLARERVQRVLLDVDPVERLRAVVPDRRLASVARASQTGAGVN